MVVGEMNGFLLIDWAAITVFIVVIILSIMIGVFFLRKYISYEEKNKNQLAFSLVFLFLGIGRILLVYFDYGVTQLNPALYESNAFWWKLATLFLLVGFGALIWTSEYALWNGKDYFVFFIGFCIVVTIAMAIPNFELSQAFSTYAIAFGGFILVSYLYLAIKLPSARKNIAMILVGFAIYGGALILLSVFLETSGMTHEIYLISAVVQMPGILIMGLGAKGMYFKA